MLLAIDVGNTNVQFGVFGDNCELLADWRLSTDRARTADEMGLVARSLFAHAGLDASRLTGIVLASVVPPLTGVIVEAGRRYFDLEPLVVTTSLLTELPVKYEPPGDVGADRLVNAVAVRDRYSVPAVVVDFGTATTFDVIDAEGAYLGGVIATGIGVSAEALFARAARLPRVDIARPEKVVGRSTVGSVQSGLFYGYVDLVDGILARIAREMENEPHVIATGGWAAVLGPECHGIRTVDPLLTLHGLRLIWTRYREDL
jgi:type III pantothenate kinase